MKLENTAGMALLKKAGLVFTAKYLSQMMEFYSTGRKTYHEEILMIARMFDEIHDVNIAVTEKRFHAVKALMKHDFVVEALMIILASHSVKALDKEAYESARDTYERIKHGIIPLLIYDEKLVFKPQDINTQVYSMGDINLNISALKEAIAKTPKLFTRSEIQTDWVFWHACKPDKIDVDYAMKHTDLSEPLLFIEKKRGEYVCADGFHRLYRAYHEELKTVPIYQISAAQYYPYLLDQRSYQRFINYWNESLFHIK